MKTWFSILMICLFALSAVSAEEPPLPAGLGGQEPAATSDEPALPAGLGGGDVAPDEADAPALPEGLDADNKPGKDTPAEKEADDSSDYLETLRKAGFSGFWEVRGGGRTQHDKYEDDASLGETRLQLQWQKQVHDVLLNVTADVLYDQAYNRMSNVNLETGSGWFDLREAWASFTPVDFMDVKIGRQILTWGTGDLLFVNDLFPKDWQAFFIGRDVEYLKAPSDAVKMAVFTDIVNVDFVYVPRFDASRFISGRRVSYFSPQLGRRAGQDAIVQVHRPNEWFDDAEYHTRVHRRFGSVELAAYGYWGYWKTPEGYDLGRQRGFYPRLSVYGGSVRGPLGRGIGNVEAAYYDSRQDENGDDPFVRNSEVRLLAGYEMDLPMIAEDLTLGLQYYVELMCQYDEYRSTLPPGMHRKDRARQVLTFRLTKQLLNQNLTLGLFAYYSPTDDDAYLRPNVQYKIDDHWTVELGGNVFLGSHEWTFFGQFERNSNLYASLRYGF